MTNDEMVQEIQQLFTAVDREARTRPVVLTVYGDRCAARVSDFSVDADGGVVEALTSLRDQLRGIVSNSLAEHEAKAETLRKALGIIDRPDAPTCAHLDAVREYIAARNAHEEAKARPLSEQSSKTYDHLLDATAKLRDAMGGAL